MTVYEREDKPEMTVQKFIVSLSIVLGAFFAGLGTAWGNAGTARAVVFVELELKPPEIRGVLWIDRDAVEVKYPIDRDGDTDYTEAELYLTRGPLTDYINQNFHLMWDGAVQPIVLTDMVYDVRPISRNSCVKMMFTVPKFSEGSELVVYSRVLSEFSQRARTMVRIDRGGEQEVWVLSPQHYYDTRLKGEAKAALSMPPPVIGRSATKDPRHACANLCLGVDLTKPPGKCPRCGAKIVRLFGAPVPGAGQIGRLGGASMPFMPGQYRVEALLATPEEFRFYLNTESLEAAPIGRLSGSVQIWTDGMMETTSHKETLKLSKDGAYLWSSVPKGMILPLRARCMFELGEGRGTRMVDFFLTGVVEVKD